MWYLHDCLQTRFNDYCSDDSPPSRCCRGVTEVLPCVFKYLNLVPGSVVFTDGVGTVH